MSQSILTLLGVLGVLVLTLLLGTGFGTELDFSLRRPRAVAVPAPQPLDAAPLRCEQP